MFNWCRISLCFTCFSCQFVFNKRFSKIYCLSVHSYFLVSFTSMYNITLKIISRKFLGVSLIWTFFSHVGAIFFKTAHNWNFVESGIKHHNPSPSPQMSLHSSSGYFITVWVPVSSKFQVNCFLFIFPYS